MAERSDEEPRDQINFPGGWTGLYIFIVLYGLLQILLLLYFTRTFNRP